MLKLCRGPGLRREADVLNPTCTACLGVREPDVCTETTCNSQPP